MFYESAKAVLSQLLCVLKKGGKSMVVDFLAIKARGQPWLTKE